MAGVSLSYRNLLPILKIEIPADGHTSFVGSSLSYVLLTNDAFIWALFESLDVWPSILDKGVHQLVAVFLESISIKSDYFEDLYPIIPVFIDREEYRVIFGRTIVVEVPLINFIVSALIYLRDKRLLLLSESHQLFNQDFLYKWKGAISFLTERYKRYKICAMSA